MARVTVVDYGRGNLFSVTRAFEYWDAEVELTDCATRIGAAERLVLPGVGAFGDAMAEMRRRNLTGSLEDYTASGRPLLGICIGMQLLFEESGEFGTHRGLGLIPGRVEAIPGSGTDGRPHKVPHVGWAPLERAAECATWEDTILAGLDANAYVYFVHSFTARPTDDGDRLADCDYDGRPISAAVHHGSLWGCQFHPEKSGPVGLAILRNFITLPSPG